MDNISNTQKTMKGVSTLTIITFLIGVVEILYFSIMSRFLTREEFGSFAAITAISSIFNNISEAGIGAALIHRKNINSEFVNTSFSLSIITGVFVTSIFLLFSDYIAKLIVGEEIHIPLMMISITILFSGMNSVFLGYMRRNLQFLKSGIITLVSVVLSSIVAIIMAVYGFGVYSVIIKAILGSALISFISFLSIKQRFRFSLHKDYISNILSYGGWLTFSVMIRTLADQVDRLMMSKLLSVRALGAYNRPKEFVLGIGGQISGIFDTVLFPVLSSIQDEKERMCRAFKMSQYNLNLFAIVLSMFFICNTNFVIRVFFGEEWIDLKLIFQIIALSLLFGINGRLGDCYFRSLGLVKQYSNFRIIELTLNVTAILVGYKWDILGIALAFFFSTMIQTTVKIIYISQKVGFGIRNLLTNILASWLPCVYYLPLLLIQHFVTTDTLLSDSFYVVGFCVISVIVFLLFPSLLSPIYKDNTYISLSQFLQNKLHR